MNTAARRFLAFGSLLFLLGCPPAATSKGMLFTYRDDTLPSERHAAISQALNDLAEGGVTQRLKAERYLTLIGPGHRGRITPYVAQLLESPKEEVCDTAVRIIITTGGVEAVPFLLDFLSSPNVMIRHDAIIRLRRIAGRDFGYEYDGSEEERKAALERWRKWWNEYVGQTAPE